MEMYLPLNSYISYIKNDDKFIKGGYIKLIFNKKNNDYLIYGSKLDKYNNDKYYKEFTINLNNIKEIYKKIDVSAIIEYQIIKTNLNNIIQKERQRDGNLHFGIVGDHDRSGFRGAYSKGEDNRCS